MAARCFLPGRLAVAVAVLAATGASLAHAAPTLPEIRLSQRNPVPACVTPGRLMAFLKQRNGKLDPRFRNIASFYKQHGEAWGVRWDYAFFQMAIETNFLTYRAPSGRMGDVDPKQNNFAGIGTTGGGVPGDSFPDVSTGVLGQIQHLVVYSGEMIPNPVAPRTQLKQEHILAKSRELKRPVRFSDLARRWAADPKYAGSIEWVAERFRSEHCKGRGAPQNNEMLPWQQKPARGADGGRAAAPAPKGAHADASAPVRTIWSRDQQKRTPPKAEPPPAKAMAEAARMPELPVAQVDVAPPVAVHAPQREAVREEEHETRFALFTPPAGLADAVIPESGMLASDARVPVPPSERPVAGPPEPPVVAAGSSVGGFVVGGSSKPTFPPPSGLGVKPSRCMVESARYGGETTVLVKASEGADVHYVALSVLDGFEDSMTASFISSRPEGGEVIGVFPSRDAALAKARTLCPD
ncbi:glucosaminidase domain-containing protein [Hyphomicrobium sp.]|uniref:glucosaminidase domain-containing protein n=1 Tax=Hyphomicrobium sp. TaxID=82 RepID=UPI0025BDBE98|nr:glucosaminidase domain-containing protein [Hyphomicrobium sp.]MCC7253429.1 glucosaminidase domain-containing protein [Hyphomicrobium sp.]